MAKLADLVPEGAIADRADGTSAIFKGGKWNIMPKDVDLSAPGAAFLSDAAGGVKLPGPEMKDLQSYRNEANAASATRADAQRFIELNKQIPTGQLGGLPIVRDIRAMFDPTGRMGEMKAITEKLTPTMRQPGSGTMSDADAAMYRASTVGIDKVGPANAAVARVIDHGSKRVADHSAFMDAWARRNGSLLGAQEAWSAYAEANPLYTKGDDGLTAALPVQPWRQWFGMMGGAQARPAVRAVQDALKGPPAGRGTTTPAKGSYKAKNGLVVEVD